MTSVSHESSRAAQEKQGWSLQLLVPDMWALLAIAVMWLSVLFDAVFGPDIVSSSGAPGVGTSSTVPSAVVVALFAFLATWVVAKYAFGHRRREY